MRHHGMKQPMYFGLDCFQWNAQKSLTDALALTTAYPRHVCPSALTVQIQTNGVHSVAAVPVLSPVSRRYPMIYASDPSALEIGGFS